MSKSKPAMAPPNELEALSFVRRRDNNEVGFNHWAVEPSGTWSADCEAGRALAEEYLAYVGQRPTYGNRGLLAAIVDDMVAATIKRGPAKPWRQIGGLELGFLHRVNDYAMATAVVCHGAEQEKADHKAQEVA